MQKIEFSAILGLLCNDHIVREYTKGDCNFFDETYSKLLNSRRQNTVKHRSVLRSSPQIIS